MKSQFVYVLLFLIAATAHAAKIFVPMDTHPPKPENIGEIMFHLSDWRSNNNEHVTISREDFLRYFKDGIFSADTKIQDSFSKMPSDINEKGGTNYCSGHFATKDGKIYRFTRKNLRVLEITDVNDKTGWLVLAEN